MSHYRRFIISASLLLASSAQAYDVTVDALYWKATEPVYWALLIDTTQLNQSTSYQATIFNYDLGFRVGVGAEQCWGWDTNLFYTRFNTSTSAAVSGNVTPGFAASKFAQPGHNYFFQSGQMSFSVDFNIFDLDFSRPFTFKDALVMRPVVGIKGGWIHQTINTSMQGTVSVIENITNNFTGVGPKIGIEGRWGFLRCKDYSLSLDAAFSTAYLWGHWSIHDNLSSTAPGTSSIILHNRDLGAFEVEELLGATLDYRCFSLKLAYEISDWFNQCQIFDDATGAHNDNLVLQGLSLRFRYAF